jgi:Zn-dependent alcohol dehydrogenase
MGVSFYYPPQQGGNSTLKAAVCRVFAAPLEIEDIHLAEPEPDQVEVTLGAVAICHSDIFFAQGSWGGRLPAVYGHEAAGIVSKVGAGVTDLRVGDHVCVTLIRSCGNCPACHRGARSECDQPWDKARTPLTGAGGEPIVRAMNCGAFAERVVVSPSQCAVIPPAMPFDVASLISCGVITGVGAVINTAKVKPGDSVAVIGAGGVGLNAIQGAAIAGAARIIAIDLLDDKLDAARLFGATHGVNAADADLPATVRAVNDGRGVDYAFVTVGAPKAFAQAPGLLAKGGAMVIVGMPPVGTVLEYEPMNMADGSYRYLGSSMGQTDVRRDIPWLVALYEQGRLKLDELVTGRWKLEQINEAIADTAAGHARRNVIVFD